MAQSDPRRDLAERIAGEITLSSDPGGTLRKWRTDFEVSQTDLADQIGVSSSVISDYESGRRESPGIGVVRRIVEGLLDVDERRGGHHIRQYGRVLSAGFDSDIVLDLKEYPATLPMAEFYESIGGTELVGGPDTVAGHTVIDGMEVLQLSSEEFYRLYGQSTSRALVFTNLSRGESPLVALRVLSPTPNAVVMHGLCREEVWEHAPELAAMDGYSLGVVETPLDEMLETLRSLP
jgi:putative transcriptional regulator